MAVAKLTGLAAVAAPDARVLVLGSMPGARSLQQQQYYAHPRNSFWAIMADIYQFDRHGPYPIRLTNIRQQGVALWDVVGRCHRAGSLDSSIDSQSVVANDFPAFFSAHPHISALLFNGAKAESLYKKFVIPELPQHLQLVDSMRMPSTSPAHAAMPYEQKLAHWRAVL
ncbi:MAG: DNA-deoxyinosine glycosylase [Gammaproteobacteria bacterium]|nr:DNA-deoxyinosine glycosylase [Gammaproteobacteria bacterium]NND38305.1 DNA-deoxyinosine glycosylase [Pseudomonadales bacterium]MBT8150960.1 DNA-deoxyinosine glycosylase [Gammaproteobacteria bacterium]NNL10756.1 DNA-deoxyinosine glycosylase [Pseudomonadales bacterium]NNM11467.1 DNA-deoxyinosine glycosylase [Pseudomonadales bacterium]